MNVKVLKVVKNEKFKGKNGKEYNKTYYALAVDGSDNIILINPVSNSDYAKLDLIAEVRYSGFPKKEDK